MFNKLEIRNFRSLKEIKIGKLNRINLVAGRNNGGKTSLLEAIFLLSGCANPDMARRISINRGMTEFPVSNESAIDYLGKPLFSDFDIDKAISLSARTQRLGLLKLDIRLSRAETTSIKLNGERPATETGLPERHAIESLFTREKQEIRSYLQYSDKGEIQYHHTCPNVLFNTRYLCPHSGNVNEDASRLGELRTQKRGNLVLDPLKILEPRLVSIEDNSAGGKPMIWCDVGLPELIPLPVMGEGMTKVVRIFLNIHTAANGVVLIDEIENGLHHSVLPDVWNAIYSAAKQCNTQIFATTHSMECVEAAHDALPGNELILLRLDTGEEGIRCVSYEESERASAIEYGLEVR